MTLRAMLTRIALLLTSTLFALFITEGALRLFITPPSRYFTWPPSVNFTFKPDPKIFYGVNGDGEFSTNPLGQRATPLPEEDTVKILTVGGSTTECLYLDDSETWPHLLERSLNVDSEKRYWVANVGRSGHRSSDHLVTLHQTLQQKPEFNEIIVMLGINDLTYFLANSKNFEIKTPNDLYNDTDMVSRSFYLHPKLYNNSSHLFSYTINASREGYRGIRNYLFSKPSQDITGSVYGEWQRSRQRASEYLQTLPNLKPMNNQLEKNLRSILNTIQEKGASLTLITQPTAWQTNSSEEDKNSRYWLGMSYPNQEREGGGAYYSISALLTGINEVNSTTKKFCEEQNLRCIYPDEVMSGEEKYFWDDVHLSELGAATLAELIAKR